MKLFAILTISLLMRLWVYWVMPGQPNSLEFGSALHDHLGSFLSTNLSLPPLNFLILGFFTKLFGFDAIVQHHLLYWVVAAMDIAATGLVYGAARELGARARFAIPASLFFSFTILSIEIWKIGGFAFHHDQYTFFFMSWFFYAYALCSRSLSWRRIAGLSIASSALVLQLSVAAYTVPVLIGVLGALIWIQKRDRAVLRLGLVVLVLGVVISGLIVRNSRSGVVSSSSKGGPVIMMFVENAIAVNHPGESLSQRVSRLRELIVSARVPEWYLWCFDHTFGPHNAAKLTNTEPTGLLDRAFGICGPVYVENAPGKPWPMDFTEILAHLRETGVTDLIPLVEKDQEDATERHYLFTYSDTLVPRWIGIFGEVSKKVARHYMLTRPGEYLYGIGWHHQMLYFGDGPNFFWAAFTHAIRPGGAFDGAKTKLGSSYLNYLKYVASPIARAAYVLIPLWLLVLLVWKRRLDANVMSMSLVWIPLALHALIYSAVVSVENSRYFINTFGILVVGLACLLSQLTRVRK